MVEEGFLTEFVNVMRLLVEHQDFLEADQKVTIGFLLPIIVALKAKLRKIESIDSGLRLCKPIINFTWRLAIVFVFYNNELKMAEMLHPRLTLLDRR